MTVPSNLPDLQNLNRIREALWYGKLHGRAALMVGSGFSRNAKRLHGGAHGFPTWPELMTKVVDALYPPDPSHALGDQRAYALKQINVTSGAMRVAEEFDSIFGRNALDDLIIREVPDLDYEPGALHRLMLKLPWAEVLTTNWDTLLERAARTVVEQRYDVVMVPEDLPRTSRPRIVKLHGTLPSNRPFIFTEEDFRTYQDRFPIFVNLVRQTMAENILCLIGFSGDDPNFLYWSGWVRDTLGKAAPRVYLCGLLDYSPSQRKMLADRNVMTVDLSSLFPAANWPDPAERHACALEWFFLALESGRPPDALVWPGVKPIPTTPPSTQALPPRPTVTHPQGEAEPYGPNRGAPQSVSDLISLWQRNQTLYPGWLVAPSRVRRQLWAYTERWIDALMQKIPDEPPWQRLNWLDTLNWRLERCLVPVWPKLADLIQGALDTCTPFAGDFAVPSDGAGNGALPNHAELRRKWSRLAFALLRHHREVMDIDSFNRLDATLRPVAETTPWLWEAVHYERCLLAFESLDYRGTASALKAWRSRDDDPIWAVRRAALHAALGEIRNARSLADHALGEIRRRLGPGGGDIGMSSREGWALLVLRALEAEGWREEGSGDHLSRWKELGRLSCDLREEVDHQMEELHRAPPQPSPPISTRVGFDPGRRSQTHHLTNEGLLPRLMPAYTFLRLVEDGGLIGRCGSMIFFSPGLSRSSFWLSDDLQTHALRAALRSEDPKALDHVVSRHRVATLPEALAQSLFEGALRTLEMIARQWRVVHAEKGQEGQDEIDNWLSMSGEIGSRVLVRMEPRAADRLADVCLHLWDALSMAFAPFRMNQLRFLIERTFGALPAANLAEWLPTIFNTPLAPERIEDDLTDLLPSHANWDGVDAIAIAERLSAMTTNLLETVANVATSTRSVALFRLLWLQSNGFLTADATDRLNRLLWERPEAGALASAFNCINRAALLDQAGPLLESAREALRGHLLDEAQNRYSSAEGNGGNVFDGNDMDRLMHVVWATKRHRVPNGIDWTLEETEHLWDVALGWWAKEGQGLLERLRDPFIGRLAMSRVAGILEFIKTVVLPRLPADSLRWQDMWRIINDIDSAGVSTSRILPALLRVFPDRFAETVSALRSDLVHSDEARVASALQGLRYWYLEADSEDSSQLPNDLLLQIGALVANRRVPALFQALDFLAVLAREKPEAFTSDLVKAVCTGLEYLQTELAYRQQSDVARGGVPFDEVPDYRAKAVALAAALVSAGYRYPEAKRWLEEAADDPLPEVRRAAMVTSAVFQGEQLEE